MFMVGIWILSGPVATRRLAGAGGQADCRARRGAPVAVAGGAARGRGAAAAGRAGGGGPSGAVGAVPPAAEARLAAGASVGRLRRWIDSTDALIDALTAALLLNSL